MSGHTNGFVKLQRSESTLEMLGDMKAMHLLTVIALRARFSDTPSLDGLTFGQALLGDYKKYNLTEKEYRNAKLRLSKYGLATFDGKGKGTVATLTSSRVFSLRDERELRKEGGLEGELFSEDELKNGAGGRAGKGRTRGGKGATNEEGKKGENESLLPSAAEEKFSKRPSNWNMLFDELARAEGAVPAQLTKSAKRKIAVALNEIVKASPDVQAGEITLRAETYRKLMPGMTLTAHALKIHWAKCTPGAERHPRPVASLPANLR